MKEEIFKLREYIQLKKPTADSLEGVVSDIILKDRGLRELLIKLCIRTGVLQSFLKESTHDILFINHCKTKLMNEHFFSEAASDKAIKICTYLIEKLELNPCIKNNKWGFEDEFGNEIIPCKHEMANKFYEGLAWVKLDNQWLTINRNDQVISLNLQIVNHLGFYSVCDCAFRGRRSKNNRDYILILQANGFHLQVDLVKGCSNGIGKFEIIQFKHTMNYGEVDAGNFFFMAFGIHEEEE